MHQIPTRLFFVAFFYSYEGCILIKVEYNDQNAKNNLDYIADCLK